MTVKKIIKNVDGQKNHPDFLDDICSDDRPEVGTCKNFLIFIDIPEPDDQFAKRTLMQFRAMLWLEIEIDKGNKNI